MGVFVQALANWQHLLANRSEGGSHFSHHFSPILYLCAPLLLAVRSPIALIVIQAFATALVVPPVYLLARRRMPERLAVLVALIALLYPPLVGIAFTDFHENAFTPAATAWLLWAVDARRWNLAVVFLLLALSIKEDQAYVIAVAGLFFLGVSIRARDLPAVRFAGVAVAASLFVLIAYFGFVQPATGAGRPWFALNYFAADANNVQHGLSAIIGRLTYLLEALTPLLFVPLLSRWFLLTVPGLLEVLASRWSITYTMGQHYAGIWVGFMLVAFAFGLAAVARTNQNRAISLAQVSLAACIFVSVFMSPTHWRHYLGLPSSHEAALERIAASLPVAASVGTYDEFFAHIALDPSAQVGLQDRPQYLVFDDRYDSVTWRTLYRPQLRALLRSGAYLPLRSEDGVTVYVRSASGKT